MLLDLRSLWEAAEVQEVVGTGLHGLQKTRVRFTIHVVQAQLDLPAADLAAAHASTRIHSWRAVQGDDGPDLAAYVVRFVPARFADAGQIVLGADGLRSTTTFRDGVAIERIVRAEDDDLVMGDD